MIESPAGALQFIFFNLSCFFKKPVRFIHLFIYLLCRLSNDIIMICLWRKHGNYLQVISLMFKVIGLVIFMTVIILITIIQHITTLVNLCANDTSCFVSRNRYWVLWLTHQIPLIRLLCLVVQWTSSNRNFEITKFYYFTDYFTSICETQNQSSNRRIFSTLIRPSAPSCSGALITREWLLRPPHPAINQVPGIRPANRLGRGTLLAASSARGNEGVRSPPPEVFGGVGWGANVGGGTCFTLRASVKILLKMLVKSFGRLRRKKWDYKKGKLSIDCFLLQVVVWDG